MYTVYYSELRKRLVKSVHAQMKIFSIHEISALLQWLPLRIYILKKEAWVPSWPWTDFLWVLNYERWNCDSIFIRSIIILLVSWLQNSTGLEWSVQHCFSLFFYWVFCTKQKFWVRSVWLYYRSACYLLMSVHL